MLLPTRLGEAGGQQVPTGCVPLIRNLLTVKSGNALNSCKPLSDYEIVAIVTLKAAFGGSVQEAMGTLLAECDFGAPLATMPG